MTRQIDWKAETIRQWNNDPCGGIEGYPPGSKEYFSAVERYRYEVYAPWMRSTFCFDKYTGKKVLEVGFGQGTDLIQFARGGAAVYGIDLTPRHVELTRQRFSLEEKTARLLRGDAENLPLSNDTFDLVYSFGVLHHTPDTQGAINEIHRILKSNGEAVITFYNRHSAVFWYIILRGIISGRLFTNGYRSVMSNVESRTRSKATPLVKVYSHSDVRRLFNKFSSAEIFVRHFDINRISKIPAGSLISKFLYRYQSALERFGWYLIVRAKK